MWRGCRGRSSSEEEEEEGEIGRPHCPNTFRPIANTVEEENAVHRTHSASF